MIINKCTIHSGLHSDHSIIKLELNRDKLKRGRCFWKFNNNLLYDKDYVDMIKNIISECKTGLRHDIDKGLIWELTKLQIRSVSIPYCIMKKQKITAFKNNLEKEINLIQSELGSNRSNINLERFNTAKKNKNK